MRGLLPALGAYSVIAVNVTELGCYPDADRCCRGKSECAFTPDLTLPQQFARCSQVLASGCYLSAVMTLSIGRQQICLSRKAVRVALPDLSDWTLRNSNLIELQQVTLRDCDALNATITANDLDLTVSDGLCDAPESPAISTGEPNVHSFSPVTFSPLNTTRGYPKSVLLLKGMSQGACTFTVDEPDDRPPQLSLTLHLDQYPQHIIRSIDNFTRRNSKLGAHAPSSPARVDGKILAPGLIAYLFAIA